MQSSPYNPLEDSIAIHRGYAKQLSTYTLSILIENLQCWQMPVFEGFVFRLTLDWPATIKCEFMAGSGCRLPPAAEG